MSRTPSQIIAEAETVFARLVEDSLDLMMWEWDGRFSAVAGAVSEPDHLHILELIGGLLPNIWDYQSLEQAPDPVQRVAEEFGGLRPGQQLFTADATDDPMFLGAWWPWGSGKRFSLRITCTIRSEEAKEADPLSMLRRLFPI